NGAEDGSVVEHEDALVGHEELEGGDALADQRVHVGQGLVVDLADYHVKSVVDLRLSCSLGHPPLEPGLETFAEVLNREVHDRGRATPGGGGGSRLEVVS